MKKMFHTPPMLVGILLCFRVYAAEPDALPEPLTLDAALSLAANPGHYQNINADQNLQQSIAEAEQTAAGNDFTINLNGRLRAIKQSGADDAENDSAIKLFVRKPLYDFGKLDASEDLSRLQVELKRLEKNYLIEQRKLSIRQQFFDVLNADNQYLRDNEELAIGFIRFDRTRENQLLGLASDLEVLETRTAYERIRQNRYNSENLQRLTRVMLAETLGYADSPPDELEVPELADKINPGDDVEALVQQAFEHSLELEIERKKLEIARQQIAVAKNTSSAKLDAELELADYVKESSTRDDWRASIYLDVPLYAGSGTRSAVRLASARYQQQLASILRVKSEIRLEVLKLWQQIRFNSLRVEGEDFNQEFRDLTLEKSRAEYELEFKSDLGNSMVQFSESRRKAWQARFALEMSLRKLETLVGSEYLNQLITNKEDNNG